MSEANVEIAREMNEAFRRGDWEAMATTLDPLVLIRTDPRWPEQSATGRDAAIAFFRSISELWGPDLRPEEIVDLGDRVLARLRWIVRGQHSGVEGEFRFSEIATYRKGRVVLDEYFFEHEQALEALEMLK
jgi:SnoaL-like domain